MVRFRSAGGCRAPFTTPSNDFNPDTKAIIRSAENYESVGVGIPRHVRVYEMRREVGWFILPNCLNITVTLQQLQLSQSSADRVFDSLGEALQAAGDCCCC